MNRIIDDIITKTEFNKKLEKIYTPEQFGAVGDGTTDDTSSIQSAIDAGYHLQGTPNKVYKITAPLILHDNMVIDGNGAKIISSSVIALSAIYKSNIIIENLEIEGAGGLVPDETSNTYGAITFGDSTSTNGCTDVIIRNCTIHEAYTGISILYGQRARVENNHVYNYGLYGVMLSRTQPFFCNHNEIHDTLITTGTNAYCISATGGSPTDPQEYCSISDNKLYNNQPWSAIMSHDIKDLIISNNHIYNARNGIDLSTDSRVENVVISGNIMVGTDTDLWEGQAAANDGLILIVGNENTEPLLFNLTITGNIIRNFGKWTISSQACGGILLSGVDGASITGNTIEQPDGSQTYVAGIFINYYCHRLAISGNYIKTANKPPIHVHNLGDGTEISIIGNTLFSVTYAAVEVSSCTIDGFIVEGNAHKRTLSGYIETGTNVIDGLSLSAPYGGRGTSKHISIRTQGSSVTDLAVGASTTLINATVPGARIGDTIAVGYAGQTVGIHTFGYVTGSDTVRVEIYNASASVFSAAASTVCIDVFKHF